MSAPVTTPANTGVVQPIAHNKRFSGVRGDSAAITWVAGILIITAASLEIAWAGSFKSKVVESDHAARYHTSYYVASASYIVAILTVTIVTIYCLWIYLDGRHPMRDMFHFKNDAEDWRNRRAHDGYSRRLINPSNAATTNAGRTGSGAAADRTMPALTTQSAYPGTFTYSLDKMNRLKANRLFTTRSHLSKLLFAEILLFILWIVPFAIFSSKDGYLQTRTLHSGIKETGICTDAKSEDVCNTLARAAITCAVLAGLFLITILAILLARPSLNPNREGYSVQPPSAAARGGGTP